MSQQWPEIIAMNSSADKFRLIAEVRAGSYCNFSLQDGLASSDWLSRRNIGPQLRIKAESWNKRLLLELDASKKMINLFSSVEDTGK